MSHNLNDDLHPKSFGMFNSFQAPKSIQVVRFTLAESGVYHDPWLRPYEVNMSYNNLDALNYTIERTQPGHSLHHVSGIDLSGIAPTIIAPSPTALVPAQVIHGWNTLRYRFVLVLQVTMPMGSISEYTLQGYTSHTGASNHFRADGQLSLDPTIIFYINSFTVASYQASPNGNYATHSMVTDCSHLLYNPNDEGVLSLNRQASLYSMRPTDIFSYMQVDRLANHGVYGNSYQGVTDTRVTVGAVPKTSSRRNGSPQDLLAAVINATLTAKTSAESGLDHIHKVPSHIARAVSEETDINQMPILTYMNERSDASNMLRSAYNYQELTKIFPELDSLAVMTVLTPDEKATQRAIRANTEPYHGSRDIDRAISFLYSTLAHVMGFMGLARVNFGARSMPINLLSPSLTPGCAINVIVAMTLVPGDKNGAQISEIFEKEFMLRIWPTLSMQNQLFVELSVKAALNGDMEIMLMLNGQHTHVVLPLFADHLYAPVVTSNPNAAHESSRGLAIMVDNLLAPTR